MSSLGSTRALATVVLLSVASQSALALEAPPTATELREGAAGSCVRAARHAGLVYTQSLDRAIAEDPAGLAALFRFAESGWCDGAAAEGHCAILFGLLQRWGDRPFSRVLRAQKRSVRTAIYDAISPMPGWNRGRYPPTYASAPH
jgi:hypothetical protein